MSASSIYASAATLGLACCLVGASHAQCRPVVAAIAMVRLDHDPFEWAATPVPLDVTIRNEGDVQCAVSAWLEEADGAMTASVPLGDGVSVALNERGGRQQGVGSPLGTLAIAAGGTAVLALEAAASATGMAPAGDRSANAWIALRPDAGGSDLARVPLGVRMHVSARAEATVSGGDASATGSIGTIDFGELVEGDSRHLVIRLRANTQSRLTVSSQNSGRLRSTAGGMPAGTPEDGIPYEIRIAGGAVDITRTSSMTVPMPGSPSGAILPLDISVGRTAGHPAGRYSDMLTVEASPL